MGRTDGTSEWSQGRRGTLRETMGRFRGDAVTRAGKRILAAMLVAVLVPTAAEAARPRRGPAALNLERIDGRWLLFNDVMQTAARRGYDPETTWLPTSLPLDENGYPSVAIPHQGSFARADLLAGNRWAPAGVYRLSFVGTGTIRVEGDAVLRDCSAACDVTVQPTGAGIALTILSSSAADRITRISLTVPGASGTFYAPTLAQLSGVKAVRSMNAVWANYYPCSNGAPTDSASCVHTWAARQPAAAIQSRRAGLAWEHLFALCNAIAADCWANIPHAADDDYVTQLAQLAASTLTHRFIPELSNELWNHAFTQAVYFDAIGAATQTGTTEERRRKAIVERLAEVLSIVRGVFQDDSRLYTVLGSFTFNIRESTALLGFWSSPALNPTGQRLDALAIAPYFGAQTFSYFAGSCPPACPTTTEIIARARADMESFLPPYLEQHSAAALDADVDLVAYEGGTLIIGQPTNPTLVDLVNAAVRLPEAGNMIDRYYALWNAAGGSLFAHFGWVHAESAYGQMLIPEATDAPPTPMWDAFRRRVGSP